VTNPDAPIPEPTPAFKHGDRVAILSGPYAGLRGVVTTASAKRDDPARTTYWVIIFVPNRAVWVEGFRLQREG
jgi:transcription antitermination factor NusG